MLSYKLGKLPVRHDSRTLKFGKYLTAQLPPPPPIANFYGLVRDWGMMGNDNYGDCTCAGAGHLIQAWTANNGGEFVVPDKKILSFYDYFSHGDPDAGANMVDVLNRWRKTGLDKHKIDGYAQIDVKDPTHSDSAISLFGGIYIGLALPDFAVDQNTDILTIPWVVPPKGPVGKAAPNDQNGHCVPLLGYDENNFYCVTWGAVKPMSRQFYRAYAEESYVPLSSDWINTKLGQSPSGLNLQQLKADLACL